MSIEKRSTQKNNQRNQQRNEQRNELLVKAKNLAGSPGVYLMKHSAGQILYVGKAKSLKNRVTSYFQAAVHEHPRTELLLQLVDNFEIIQTETENEALILECTLIKRYKPKYNIRLKDDKHYPYLKISMDVDYPKIEWTRKVESDNARYFGPFPSSFAARTARRLLTEAFRLRDCSDNTFLHRSRPCILYQMDQCSGPCVAKISKEDYHQYVDQVILILEGKTEAFLRDLKLEMETAAQEERFEDAATIRDQIQSIQIISETQSVLNADQRADQDVVAFQRNEQVAQGVVLQVRGGKLLSVKHYSVQNYDSMLKDQEIVSDLLAQHFLLMDEKGGLPRAKEILIKEAPEDLELLENTLGIKIREPETEAQKQLLNVALTNAQFALKNAENEKEGHGLAALEEVQSRLGLEQLPRRIECFDIYE